MWWNLEPREFVEIQQIVLVIFIVIFAQKPQFRLKITVSKFLWIHPNYSLFNLCKSLPKNLLDQFLIIYYRSKPKHQHYLFFHRIESYPSNSNLNMYQDLTFHDLTWPQVILNLCYYSRDRYELSYLQYISIFYVFPNLLQLAFPSLFHTRYILFLVRDIRTVDRLS